MYVWLRFVRILLGRVIALARFSFGGGQSGVRHSKGSQTLEGEQQFQGLKDGRTVFLFGGHPCFGLALE